MTDKPELPSHELLLHQPQWAQLTMKQLQKDAELCGIEWSQTEIPTDYNGWIEMISERLSSMEKQNPEYLSRFLYRVDLPERTFVENPLASEEMAEAVLKRAFMKVWFKSKYST